MLQEEILVVDLAEVADKLCQRPDQDSKEEYGDHPSAIVGANLDDWAPCEPRSESVVVLHLFSSDQSLDDW